MALIMDVASDRSCSVITFAKAQATPFNVFARMWCARWRLIRTCHFPGQRAFGASPRTCLVGAHLARQLVVGARLTRRLPRRFDAE